MLAGGAERSMRVPFRKNSDPFGPLIIANRNATWRAALEENIKILRLNGTDIQEIVRIRQDYLESMHKTLRSMIISGLFRSNTVSQMLEIAKLMDFTSVCTGPPRQSVASLWQRVARSRRCADSIRSTGRGTLTRR